MRGFRRRGTGYGLRTRLLIGTVVVAAGAVAATAWLSVQGTTSSIAHQERSLRQAYAEVYGRLVRYAATHTDWSSVGPVLVDLARNSGTRIVITPVGGQPIASSPAPSDDRPTTVPSVSIDPLAVNNALAGTHFPDGISTRVVGPFLLPPQEHAILAATAGEAASCLRRHGMPTTIAVTNSGRPYLRISSERAPKKCQAVLARNGLVGFQDTPSVTPTATEQAALRRLREQVNACLGGDSTKPKVYLNGMGELFLVGVDGQRAQRCLLDARRQLLRPYVAPTALLRVMPASQRSGAGVGLSSVGALQIAGFAVIILLLTVGVAMLLANRVIRPVRTLTDATRRMRAGDGAVRAETSSRWEIAELTRAFNDMAEHVARTDQQRKELISDISHELRTPLGTVRGWLTAAQDGVADLDPELVSSLLDETLMLQHLVDDLRDLALVDAGQLRLEPVELNLAQLLRHVVGAYSERVHVRAPSELVVVADPVRLRQVVGNLVANAERHTPHDGRITVSAEARGAGVAVAVTDTGPGIAAEDLPHVFDRFWRADKSRDRRSGGSGLGLAIVRQLVEAHGGEIAVSSTPDAGSSFTLWLPHVNELS